MPDPKTIRHLGLDIGTTNTSLCYTSYTPSEGQFNVPTPTRFGDDDFLHSAILLDDYDRPIAFGDEALRHPVYQAHPERLREEFKLGLGDDPAAEQLVTQLAAEAARRACGHLQLDGFDEQHNQATVGVPAHWVLHEYHRVEAMMRAANAAGLPNVQATPEPVAAMLFHTRLGQIVFQDHPQYWLVIDIGGGTTDLILFADGGVAHVSVIPAGGNNITSDVAAGLRTPMAEAERLKRNYGCALGRMVNDDEEIEVPGVGGHGPRRAARRLLSDIIEPRVEEIFSEARRRIEETGLLEQVSSGCVLTGGAALMEGMVECAEEILGMPVRLGFPVGVRGIVQLVQGPQYATGVGLVRYGAQQLADACPRGGLVSVEQVALPSEAAPKQKSGLWSWIRAAF
jgi:hypothetical protein